MITRTQISLVVGGDTFRPSTIAAPFSNFEDVGDVGKFGRYRGVSVPAGFATFSVPENEQDGIRYLYSLVFPLMPILRAAGATDFFIHITFHYEQQCALGFDAEEMQMLSDFGCTVSIDCLKDDSDDK